MRTMHLFAGAGGGLLADLILGHEPVVAVEWNAYACQVLRERTAEGWFPDLCVYEGDVRLFDPSEYAGRVDCIHAGWPCQDISVAGPGAGIKGKRSGLWSEVRRIAGAIRPGELFLENSPAITSRGLGTVLGDLAALGYDARWIVLGAAAVGAPHLRARWWCLARRTDTEGSSERAGLCQDEPGRIGRARLGDLDGSMADAECNGREARAEQTERAQGIKADGLRHEPRADVAYSDMRDGEDSRRMFSGIHRPTESTREKRSCGESGGRERGWWDVEPDVGRISHGVAARVDRLECIGNGQVPLQAAAAYLILNERWTIT